MQPFVPHKLPVENLDWSKFVALIGAANREIAKFDSLLNSIPEPEVLLSPLTTNEAVLSSRIEGTQASLEDVYKFEASPKERTAKYEDIQEIINYRRAIIEASAKLNKLPLSGRLIREIHKTLLSGARGKTKLRVNLEPDKFTSARREPISAARLLCRQNRKLFRNILAILKSIFISMKKMCLCNWLLFMLNSKLFIRFGMATVEQAELSCRCFCTIKKL